MKIAILFGGSSKEREISLASGRTVYDNIDRKIFQPIPIFIDTLSNFIILKPQHLYKGTIRDFYPPPEHQQKPFQHYIESIHPQKQHNIQQIIKTIGKQIFPHQFSSIFDFAFLALHGTNGEDGTIQGLLEWYGIPYSGTGILGSAIGIDKEVQKNIMTTNNFKTIPHQIIEQTTWQQTNKKTLLQNTIQKLKLPLAIKSTTQGSSIGVSILKQNNIQKFITAINKALQIHQINPQTWNNLNQTQKHKHISSIIDITQGIGLPVITPKQKIIQTPKQLLTHINQQAQKHPQTTITLTHTHNTQKAIIEPFINGTEFSCIVIQQHNQQPTALPPTEIIKKSDHLTYTAKYLPGIIRKNTPINTTQTTIQNIQQQAIKLFQTLNCQVYARIDGFLTQDKQIILNDPNTTAGLQPSSFIFHQAAEAGFNPTQFITFIIQNSLQQRIKEKKVQIKYINTPQKLTQKINTTTTHNKQKIGIIIGGPSAEKHISLEGGRNIYQKLLASTQYQPIPIFLSGTTTKHQLTILPIKLLLKDNTQDIEQKIKQTQNIQHIQYKNLKQHIDFAFINIHGRPGEDGQIQKILQQHNIPYNGSSPQTSQITIDKFKTNQILQQHNITTAKQKIITKKDWTTNQQQTIKQILQQLKYPIIAKPLDDGCSNAVAKIDTTAQLTAYAKQTFQTQHTTTELPQKDQFLIEQYISQKNPQETLHEITVGFLTHINNKQNIQYEIFQPSQTISLNTILSLEEKFLAGQGQNITPITIHPNQQQNQQIIKQIQQTIHKVAKILNLEGYGRIDAFIKTYKNNAKPKIFIIEVNTLPAMTPATCIFHQCAINNYTPLQFIHKIIQYGINKNKKT